ncbi:basic amino acid ABC transporter substrate-binding protein [Desulfallas thermosapovorans]|uniref:Amino acid ABC transporter substrate-binding protein, PAAT family (TC 3.A.1.3.-) n=1 Tax=Desulfallas thermosapovorans DSM 6562 TaxID=1121431 RepID=A0A5S4ZWL8_9FIRM|nr:basic amino acid ABC transporter substrate-binding protein [Desulfallas thermosapovorans]TYO97199.1 amino acid ABC transporter substrate-binding protein, PAAT family (TC 3.A.1.3.-) [Desulfallas thermosapovorans DSM 6562]
MKKIFRAGLVLFTVLAMVFALAGCGGEQANDANNGQTPATAGDKLVFGSDTSYAPFEFSGADGKLTGFDVELIAAINEAVGTNIEIISYDFKGLVPALETASIDGAISAMTITEDRLKKVDFSMPYYLSGQSVAVQAKNETIKGFDDLEGKKIGVQTGTTGEIEANKVPNANIISYDTMDGGFMDLNNGAIDAIICDFPVVAYYINQGNDGIKIVGDMQTSEHYGIAVPKQKPEVLEAVNEGLRILKENGKYAELYKKWFGVEPPEYLPGEPQS